MIVAVKAMHTANMRTILLESLLSDVEMCSNGSELWWTSKIDVVTFDFKGTRVLWVGSGSTG